MTSSMTSDLVRVHVTPVEKANRENERFLNGGQYSSISADNHPGKAIRKVVGGEEF